MIKTLRVTTLLLLAAPLLSQCVPAQDVNSLDLRVRNLDNQVFQLGKTVNQMGGASGAGNPLEQITAKQAEMADNIDRLNNEILRMKGSIDEKNYRAKNSQSDNDMLKSTLQKKVDELSQQVAALTDQVNQNTSALKSGAPVAVSSGTTVKSLEPTKVAPVAEKTEEKATPTKSKEVAVTSPSKAKDEGKKVQEDSEAASAGDPGKAIYDQGLELFRASKFNEAYRTFSDYITKYPKGNMAPNARFWLGDCYYNQQEYELAILEYQKVIADYPSDGKAPSALLKQGLAFEKLKDNETAKIVYNKLMKEYPKSDQVETAKKRIESFK
ncbi:MAG: tol-pal system protein YbgF [Desulfobulbaceae bacterium]|nr:tol-pal system protein YbgF [Desulfobulbaceae bacterium]